MLLNVVQSPVLKTPLTEADAVGTLSVITGVVVPLATELERSVPVVARVSAATLVTVPTALDVPAPIAVLKSLSLKAVTLLSILELVA